MNNIVYCSSNDERIQKMELTKQMLSAGYDYCKLSVTNNIIFIKRLISDKERPKVIETKELVFKVKS